MVSRIPPAPLRELKELREKLSSGELSATSAVEELDKIIVGTGRPDAWRLVRIHVQYRFRKLSDQEISELLKVHLASEWGLRNVPEPDDAVLERIEAPDGDGLVEKHEGRWGFRTRRRIYLPFVETTQTITSKVEADAAWKADATWSILQVRKHGVGGFKSCRARCAPVVVPEDVLSDNSRCLLLCVARAVDGRGGWEQVEREWRSLRKITRNFRAKLSGAIHSLRGNNLIEGTLADPHLTERGRILLARAGGYWRPDGSRGDDRRDHLVIPQWTAGAPVHPDGDPPEKLTP